MKKLKLENREEIAELLTDYELNALMCECEERKISIATLLLSPQSIFELKHPSIIVFCHNCLLSCLKIDNLGMCKSEKINKTCKEVVRKLLESSCEVIRKLLECAYKMCGNHLLFPDAPPLIASVAKQSNGPRRGPSRQGLCWPPEALLREIRKAQT